MANQSAEETVTTREAAELLGISLRTAQLWVESGVLRAWKTLGGHRRILRSSVNQLLQERADATRSRVPATDGSDDFRVLVVEDEPSLLRLYELTLAGWKPPVSVTLVSNGWEALMAIGQSKPDLLITDLRLPGMDGFRMLRVLKSDPAFTRKMDIIVVTGMERGDMEAFGGVPEGVAILQKPLSFDALEKMVIEIRLRRSGKITPPAGSSQER
jgi:excisionase family DNA binding protein